jgi:hypothetical protein
VEGRVPLRPRFASERILAGNREWKVPVAKRIFVWAFSARAAVGIAAYLLTVYSSVPFLEDALWYEEEGYSVAQEWLSGRWGALDTLPNGVQMAKPVVATIAGFYYVTGGTRALSLLLVAYGAITATIPVYVYWIASELGAPERAAKGAGWLVALSPAFVLFSGSLHKEGLILLSLSVAAYHALRLQSRWRPRSFITLVLSLLVLFALRYYMAIVVCGAVALGLAAVRGANRPGVSMRVTMPMLIRQGAIVAAFVGLVGAVGFQESADRPLEESPEGLLVQVDQYRRGLAMYGQSGYLPDVDASTPQRAAEFAPVGLLYFLAAPFPWQTGSLRQTLVIPETVFWVLLYPLVGVGMARSYRVNRPGTVMLIAATGGMCIVYALMSGNIGIAYRMRTQVWLLLAPFAAWGWEAWRERRRRGREAQLVGRRPRPLATRSR